MSVKNQKLLERLTTVLVCFVMLIAFMISGVRLLGFQVYGVLSGSMEPTYPTGSLIYVRKVNPDDLQLRDVITFRISGSTIATHRIVEIVTDPDNSASRSFRTQGDANDSPDANLVSPGSVIGKVSFCIPHMGNLASLIQSPGGTVVTIILCLALVGVVFYTDSLAKKRNRDDRKGGRSSFAGAQSRSSSETRRRTGGSQLDQRYQQMEYRPRKQPSRPSSQRSDYQRDYYGARDGYSRQDGRRQYDHRDYPPRSHARQRDDRPEYGYRSEDSSRAYSRSRYADQDYSRQRFDSRDEARHGYSGRQQRSPQSSANRSGGYTRTDPRSRSYTDARDYRQ